MNTKRYCLVCDLKDDPILIEEYKEHHKNVWPEILKSIKESGIEKINIYNLGNRLFMVIEVNKSFFFDKKATLDANNPKVQEWEELMWKYQQALPLAKKGEKWLLLEEIFKV
ncbi:L-fucose mutarotase [Polaribacter vadi]|uniref:L-fucose mutarotase n=1 Tax=Polaribacter vadi TaxID=1774273 RepID=A0A1B8TSG9_9FLAO|nr:L-rhamnose mutarotase [Polaribacter vadi]AOW17816.1 L-fucose mutarotase [Polaribacter vadi]OBY62542.1 L-fucose mutarotase [Polaribacter vadi]